MARTEEQMTEELTGMAAPTEDMQAPEETSPMLSVDTMMSNYEAMEPTKQRAVLTLLNEPISQLFDELTGQTVISQFSTQIAGAPSAEPTPTPEGEGMMAPTEEEATPPA